jgi:hypothetical protein
MRLRIAVGFTLITAVSQAAEPPATTAAPAAAASKPAATTPAPATTRPPLKLAVGDVRKYMMPKDYVTAISANESDKTIVVEGEREAPPLRSEQPQMQGLGAVYSLFRYPTNAWRLFIPDPKAPELGPPDPVPQREFRRGP